MVHERRRRRVKDPQERKEEILNQAMVLFTEQGYENTSMRDIASSLHISLGLCYRYYDSKQILFQEAMDKYVEMCCQLFVQVFEYSDKQLPDKMKDMFDLLMKEENIFQYHDFFHQSQNKELHNQLSIQICEKIMPYIRREIIHYCEIKHYHIRDVDSLVSFLTYGQIGLLSDVRMPDQNMIKTIQRYINILMQNEMIPD